MKTIKFGLAFLLVACLVLFMLQNLGMASVRFLAWKAELPVAVPIFAAFFIGGVAARPMIRFLNERRRERSADRSAAKAGAKQAAKTTARKEGVETTL